MLTDPFPPNTALSLSSALIIRLFFLSWRPFFLMYAQSFFVTSVRGIAFAPTTSASVALGVTGFMKAALGFLFALAMRSVSSERRSGVRERLSRNVFLVQRVQRVQGVQGVQGVLPPEPLEPKNPLNLLNPLNQLNPLNLLNPLNHLNPFDPI